MGKRLDAGRQDRMARTLNRLTAMKVAKAKKPGLLADGGGLYLRIAPGGSKQFIFRYAVNGRLRDMGIGPTHTVDLAMAREKALEARRLRLDGVDPIAHKHARMAALRAADARAVTFRQAAEGFIKDNEKEWTSARHRDEWRSTLSRYAFPVLGSLPVAAIDTPLVLKVVKPLWERVPATARRLLGRIENVLGWATVHHYRTGDNPARWDGLIEHALPTVSGSGKHHAALPFTDVAAFMTKVLADASVAARCLEFIALTAARLGEANKATWNEIDLENRIWTVPSNRMKGGKEHRVPLSDAAIAVLTAMREARMNDWVFPGSREGRPVGARTVRDLVKEIAGSEITTHGFRSSFRDWASERTNFSREVAEMALAHTIPNAVEAAYRRGDLFEKRRKLMEAWAEFCSKPQSSGKVVPIAARR
jgi:integrase